MIIAVTVMQILLMNKDLAHKLSQGEHYYNTDARDMPIDPNNRLRVGMSVFSGMLFFDSVCWIFISIMNLRLGDFNGLATFFLVSSIIALIFSIGNIMYLLIPQLKFRGKTFLPWSIFGGFHLLFMCGWRTYVFISYLKRVTSTSYNTSDVIFIIID